MWVKPCVLLLTMPTASPLALNTGPPELPPVMRASVSIMRAGANKPTATPYTTADAGHDESRMIELVNRWLLSYPG